MKLALKIIGVVLVVIVAAVAGLLFTFDPDDWKPQISSQVEQHTGRTFEIKGDIGWSLFPWIGLEINAVSLSNAEGFSQKPFAQIEQLDVRVKLLPLLEKKIEADRIKLHGVSVSLEVDEQGNNNWSDLAGQAPEKPDPEKKQQAEPSAPAASPLAGLAINGVELVRASIRYHDAGSVTEARITDVSLETGAIRFGQPVPVSFSARIVSLQPDLKADIALESQIRFNQALTRFDISNLSLLANSQVPEITSETIALQLGLDAHIDMEQQTATLTDMVVGVFNVVIKGAFEVENMQATPGIKGAINTSAFDARELAGQFNVELPPMARADALSKVSMKTQIETDTSKINLDDLIVKIDDSSIKGWIHIDDASLPAVSYSLAMGSINIDDYMAPPAKTKTAMKDNNAGAQTDTDVEIELPVDVLRKLELDGRLELEQARVQDIVISSILIISKAKGGVIDIDPVSMKALNGTIETSVKVDVRKGQKFSLKLDANELEAGEVVDPMLQGLLGDQPLSLEGKVKLGADITTDGNKLSLLKKNATGKVQIDMNETSVSGVDIEYFMRGLVADYLTEKSIPVSDDFLGKYAPEQKTAFNSVHATATMKNGVVSNDDLLLDSSRINVTGKGSANIIKNTIDYRATVDLNPPRVKTLVEKALDQPIDIHVHGPFAQPPAVEPDISKLRGAVTEMIKAEAAAKARQKLEQEKQKLREEAERKKREAEQKLEQKKREAEQRLEQQKKQKEEELKNKVKDKLKDLF